MRVVPPSEINSSLYDLITSRLCYGNDPQGQRRVQWSTNEFVSGRLRGRRAGHLVNGVTYVDCGGYRFRIEDVKAILDRHLGNPPVTSVTSVAQQTQFVPVETDIDIAVEKAERHDYIVRTAFRVPTNRPFMACDLSPYVPPGLNRQRPARRMMQATAATVTNGTGSIPFVMQRVVMGRREAAAMHCERDTWARSDLAARNYAVALFDGVGGRLAFPDDGHRHTRAWGTYPTHLARADTIVPWEFIDDYGYRAVDLPEGVYGEFLQHGLTAAGGAKRRVVSPASRAALVQWLDPVNFVNLEAPKTLMQLVTGPAATPAQSMHPQAGRRLPIFGCADPANFGFLVTFPKLTDTDTDTDTRDKLSYAVYVNYRAVAGAGTEALVAMMHEIKAKIEADFTYDWWDAINPASPTFTLQPCAKALCMAWAIFDATGEAFPTDKDLVKGWLAFADAKMYNSFEKKFLAIDPVYWSINADEDDDWQPRKFATPQQRDKAWAAHFKPYLALIEEHSDFVRENWNNAAQLLAMRTFAVHAIQGEAYEESDVAK